MGLLFLMRGILAGAEDVVGTSGGTFVPNEGHSSRRRGWVWDFGWDFCSY